MKVIDELKDFSVHNHQLNKCGELSRVVLFKVDIKDLCKSDENHVNLRLSKDFQWLLVLKFESPFIFKEKIR